MAGFAYVAPSSIDEAVAVLAEHAGQGLKAQVIAGGTDLLVQMRSLNKAARTIVDIKKIGETGRLDIGADETFIGAGICWDQCPVSRAARIRRPDRLHPDPGTRDPRGEPVQRLPCGGHHSGNDRQRRRLRDSRTRWASRAAGRGFRRRCGPQRAAGRRVSGGPQVSQPSHCGCVPAVHSAHRDGHRRGGGRRADHAGRRRDLHGSASGHRCRRAHGHFGSSRGQRPGGFQGRCRRPRRCRCRMLASGVPHQRQTWNDRVSTQGLHRETFAAARRR